MILHLWGNQICKTIIKEPPIKKEMIINLFDLEKKFSLKLPKAIEGYYSSGARDEITLNRNREIFNSYELLPKLLRDVSKINTSINLNHSFFFT